MKIWERLHIVTKEAELLGMTKLLEKIRATKPLESKVKRTFKYEPIRNANVRAYVRLRAKHCCELCGERGFEEDDGSLYIEVHHLQLLAKEGTDTPDNAVALCANCHRKLHFSKDKDRLREKLKRKVVFIP